MHSPRSNFTPLYRLDSSANGARNSGIYVVKSVRTGAKCIEKRVIVRDIHTGHAFREVRSLEKCNHPNIAYFVGADLDYTLVGYGSIYMQHCELGALNLVIHRFATRRVAIPEGFLWKVLWDIGLALCYLQYGVDGAEKATRGVSVQSRRSDWQRIFHRDLKPANIFLTFNGIEGKYPRAVLGDFGLSISRDEVQTRRASCGTPAFEPPEAPFYSAVSDIFSLGLIIHCMAKLVQYPREGDERRIRMQPLAGTKYSSELDHVLPRCLRRDENERINAGDLVRVTWREKESARKGVRNGGFGLLPRWAFE